MNHLDHRRALGDLACQVARGDPLTDDQRDYLALVLFRISTGEDANVVLQVTPTQGVSDSDAIARRRMSLILHWVACAVNPDPNSTKKAMSIETACGLATNTIVPLAKAMFPGADGVAYDSEYIQRCWGKREYAHMRSSERGLFDPDYPY